MNKTKILTVLGVIMAMGLTGCKSGNKSSSTEPGKSSAPASQQSSGGGQQSSGGGQQSSQAPAGYTAPVHHWSNAETDPHVDADAEKGTVAYWTRSCTDHTGEKGIEIHAKDGKLVDGGKFKNDSSFPDYMKLDKIGDGPAGGAVEYKFEYTGYAKGTIFQRAVMDYWHDGSTNNENRGYYSGKGDGETTGNFKLEVNGKAVDFSKFKDITYGDMLPEEKNETGNNYSQLVDCEIGEITIHEGINTIKYTRLDSYNMVIKDFVLAVKDEQHTHTFGAATKVSDADCENPQMDKKVCSVCGYEVVEANAEKPALGHDWGTATEVAADAEKGTSLVKKSVCSRCHKVKYEVPLYLGEDLKTKNFTLSAGAGEKTYQPAGSIKLSGNNQYLTFKVEFAKLSYGMIYQKGSMDQYGIKEDGTPNNNHNQKYTSGGSSTSNGCNFKFEVNGVEVDMSAYKNEPVSTWLGLETREIVKNDKGEMEVWSLAKDCPIGEFAVEAGVVEFKYTRLGSYNLANEAFTFVVTESDHQHTKATAWSHDDDGHWHECTDKNCPLAGVKLDYAAHEWGEGEVTKAATADAEGLKTYTCACGAKKTEVIPVTPFNTWTSAQVIEGCTKASPNTVSFAEEGLVGLKTNSIKNSDNNKLELTYTATEAKTVTLRLRLSIKTTNNNVAGVGFWYNDGHKETPKEKTRILVNDTAVTAPAAANDINFKNIGLTVNDTVAKDGTKATDALAVPVWVDICNVQLAATENKIAFTIIDTNYSYFICGAALVNIPAAPAQA